MGPVGHSAEKRLIPAPKSTPSRPDLCNRDPSGPSISQPLRDQRSFPAVSYQRGADPGAQRRRRRTPGLNTLECSLPSERWLLAPPPAPGLCVTAPPPAPGQHPWPQAPPPVPGPHPRPRGWCESLPEQGPGASAHWSRCRNFLVEKWPCWALCLSFNPVKQMPCLSLGLQSPS